MSSDSPIPWFDSFLGVAYRYYEIRMNVVPLFSDLKIARKFWMDTMHWWNDHSIKIRFVETGDNYWFIMGAESRNPKNNRAIFKVLPKSPHFDRFKKGHEGTAYLRLGTYVIKSKKMSKMMQNVTVVISRKTMKRGKTMTAVFLRTAIVKNLKPFK